MLATKQAMLTLVPTRSGKCLHGNKKVWQQDWSTASQGGTSGKDVASSQTLDTKDYCHSSCGEAVLVQNCCLGETSTAKATQSARFPSLL